MSKLIPFPVVTPAMTDIFTEQRPHVLTVMNSWLSHCEKGDDIHTDRAHFQKNSSQTQRGSHSALTLVSRVTQTVAVSLQTCICARPPSQQRACLVITTGHLSRWKTPGWRRQRAFKWAETFAGIQGEVKQTRVDLYSPAKSQTKHTQECTKMLLLWLSK